MVKNKPVVKKSRPKVDKSKINKPKFRGPKRGWVYVGHIPHGFYEEEMSSYFEQFGKVLNVRVCRSRKTGKPKGYGFIEFENEEVAKITAETMNNYLMFKKRLDVKFIPAHKMRRIKIVKGEEWSEENYPLKQIRKDVNYIKNTHLDQKSYLKRCRQYLQHVTKIINKLNELGIEYSFTPVDVPSQLTDS